jgi:hypothetical protein
MRGALVPKYEYSNLIRRLPLSRSWQADGTRRSGCDFKGEKVAMRDRGKLGYVD